MTKPAIEFVAHGTKLYLIYRPRDDDSWVHDRLARGEPLDIKGTFHLTMADLAEGQANRNPNDLDDEDGEVRFVVLIRQQLSVPRFSRKSCWVQRSSRLQYSF